jgi:predicted Rossmann fold nucleotide-binding protein DprA/Smf involved in DNA uptake
MAVTGSRSYPADDWAFMAICMIAANVEATEIIHGGARGVDMIADSAAEQCRVPVRVLRPDYKSHANCPKYAPLARNVEIVNLSDVVVAFWDGESKGTLHTIKKAEEAGKLLRVYGPEGKPLAGFRMIGGLR